MKITLTDNLTNPLVDFLVPFIRQADEVKFGVAFLKYSGLALIDDAINECLRNGGHIEFLVGLDFRTTEPKALRTIHDMTLSGQAANVYCFSDPIQDDAPVYHPKIYLLKQADDCVMSIGSSNLTRGGLTTNVEINVVIETSIDNELASDAYGIYNRLKFQENLFSPDLAYIADYQDIYEIVHQKNIDPLIDRATGSKIKKLKEKEEFLPKPQLTDIALVGWQKLVNERLPVGEFQTSYMYEFEDVFRQFYPENKHIKDKVRQILQQLRDLGLLNHISGNRWRKV